MCTLEPKKLLPPLHHGFNGRHLTRHGRATILARSKPRAPTAVRAWEPRHDIATFVVRVVNEVAIAAEDLPGAVGGRLAGGVDCRLRDTGVVLPSQPAADRDGMRDGAQ